MISLLYNSNLKHKRERILRICFIHQKVREKHLLNLTLKLCLKLKQKITLQ